jgi:hypothetical protein
MAIDGTVSVTTVLNDRRTNVGLPGSTSGTTLTASRSPAITFVDGAGASAMNAVYARERTLSGAAEDLDLAGGLTDQYGGTITFVRVKSIYIKNTGNANIVVGGDGSSPWATLLNSTGTLTLPPGAFFSAGTQDATGWTVTASSGDLLQVAGTSGQTYEIIIGGATS